MAKFYIQLKDKRLKISDEITAASISKALGYTPSDFSGNFEDLINNPLLFDDSGELKVTDESGNIIVRIDSEGIHSLDFVGGIHKLSEKANKSDLPKKLSELENDLILDDVATKDDINNIEFNSIKNNPLYNDENGEFNIIDEQGNIGLKLNQDGLYVKDVHTDSHKLSSKADKTWVTEYVTSVVTDGKVTLEGFATEEYVDEKERAIQEWVDDKNFATQEDIANIDFNSLKNNPVIDSEEGKLVFLDDEGYIGLQLDGDGLYVRDVIAGEHKLSEKIDFSEISNLGYATETFVTSQGYLTEHQDISHLAEKSEIPSLQGYATQSWINNQEFAHQSDLLEISFNEIKNSPIREIDNGEMNVVDEKGNVGLKLSNEGLYAKDVIVGDHILSQKADTKELENYVTLEYLNEQLGNINVILDRIINGGEANLLTNKIFLGTTMAANESSRYFWTDYPVESDITITAKYSHPTRGEITDIYTISKGNNIINEEISHAVEFEKIIITPQKDSKYIYQYAN